jgi:hypothetical protein
MRTRITGVVVGTALVAASGASGQSHRPMPMPDLAGGRAADVL